MKRLLIVAVLALAACTPQPTVIVVPAERCWRTVPAPALPSGAPPQQQQPGYMEVPCQ